jgi:membrane dipeptidase
LTGGAVPYHRTLRGKTAGGGGRPMAWSVSDKAAELHRKCLVWDQTLPWIDFGRPQMKEAALPRYKASGVDFVSLTVASDESGVPETIRTIAKERAFLRAHPDFVFCETADDIVDAKKQGKLGVNFHFQGTNPFGRSLEMVALYYKLGVRHALMAYNQKNSIGDGCHERTDGGLTRMGVALVREMNRVGMMVDVSHTGYRTTMDVFGNAQGPVIFSHSNPRALNNHPRNIADDQIKACAASGGVIGVNGIGVFMAENDASTELLLRQIDYLVQLVGPRHVGIGLDWVYDLQALLDVVDREAARYPDKSYQRRDMKIADPEQLPGLTEGMLNKGYKEGDIEGILGGNWLRVARQVWK